MLDDATRRPLVDRLLRSVRPAPLADYCPPPRSFADGVWLVERKLRLPFGLVLPCNMTVIRLVDGRLVLHSPVKLDEATRRQIRALGSVAAVIAPNSFHYLFVGEYTRAFECRVYLAPDLPMRIPDCPPGTVLTDAVRADWSAELEHCVFGPVRRFTEVVLRHASTSTVILTDLAFNMGETRPLHQRLLWRATGVPRGFGPSRTARLTFLSDRRLARPGLERILRWDFDRVVVAHGAPVGCHGKEIFARAFRRFLS